MLGYYAPNVVYLLFKMSDPFLEDGTHRAPTSKAHAILTVMIEVNFPVLFISLN